MRPIIRPRAMEFTIFILLVAIFVPTASHAQRRFPITTDEYHDRLGLPCACPYDHARDGSTCGGRSAFCRCNGYEPIGCYPRDGDPEERKTSS